MLRLCALELEKLEVNFGYFTGDMNSASRTEAMRLFQQLCKVEEHGTAVRVLLMSINAGNEGITMTEASCVIIMDPWWQAVAEEQAIARAHRIGQKHQIVVYRLISKDTIGEYMTGVKNRKVHEARDGYLAEVDEAPDFESVGFIKKLFEFEG